MGGLEDRVASVRRFSRFYTRKIGVLHEGLLGSPLSADRRSADLGAGTARAGDGI